MNTVSWICWIIIVILRYGYNIGISQWCCISFDIYRQSLARFTLSTVWTIDGLISVLIIQRPCFPKTMSFTICLYKIRKLYSFWQRYYEWNNPHQGRGWKSWKINRIVMCFIISLLGGATEDASVCDRQWEVLVHDVKGSVLGSDSERLSTCGLLLRTTICAMMVAKSMMWWADMVCSRCHKQAYFQW